MGRKLQLDYFCAGPLLAEYIQGPNVHWGRVADAVGMPRRNLDDEQVGKIKANVMSSAQKGGRERLSCKYPMKALFEKVPADGQMHVVVCPRCGNKCDFEHGTVGDED